MTDKHKNIAIGVLSAVLVVLMLLGNGRQVLGISHVQTTDTIGTLRTTVNTIIDTIQNTTSSLGAISGLSTTTGNLIVASGTNWVVKTVGANGKVLTASSTAAGGISWESVAAAGVSSLNGLTGALTANIFNTTTTVSGGVGISVSNGGIGATTITNTAPNFNTTTSLNGLTGAITGLNIFNGTTTWGGLTGNIVVRPSSSIGLATTTTGFVDIGVKNFPIQFIVENPTSTENDFVFSFNTTSTITKVIVAQKATGDVWTGWNMAAATSSASATTTLSNLFTANQLSSRTTTTQTYTPNGTTVAPLGSVLRIFNTSATAPSSSQWSATIYYDEN